MPEALTRTLPPVPEGREDYRVTRVELDWERPRVAVVLHSQTGTRIGHQYEGPVARDLLRALNTANLSAQSLHRRVLQRLVQDGIVTGAITGAPD